MSIDVLYFLRSEFWASPVAVTLFMLLLCSIIFIRYFIVSKLYLYVASKLARRYKHRWLHHQTHSPDQHRREMIWSLCSSLIFAFIGTLSYWLYHHGYTAIYVDYGDYSTIYSLSSIIIALAIHETYYYWIHRLMHHRKIFRYVHRIHHESRHTSVFSALSFHPLETFLQALIFPLMIMILPLHPISIAVLLILMTLSATINHAGIEVYPVHFSKNPILRWLIGATHHHMHHKRYDRNYGLYFRFWDVAMKTESDVCHKQDAIN